MVTSTSAGAMLDSCQSLVKSQTEDADTTQPFVHNALLLSQSSATEAGLPCASESMAPPELSAAQSSQLQLPVRIKRRSQASLTDWHRRRRASASGLPSSQQSGELFPFSPFSPMSPGPCPSPPQEIGGQAAWGSVLSPLTCPSPADFMREDLIKRNIHSVHEEYEFGSRLGKGSFGQVHEATHRKTRMRRAVKELQKSGTETEDFEWELQALVALDHPHIVKVIEWFDDEDKYYIAMELCTGPDLAAYILERMGCDANRLPERECSIILRQCLKAVLCCHANGFVHRDLNARNFMLTGVDRTVKLIDFGLTRRFKGFLPPDQFIEIVGTSHYMAPEMMLDGEYSPAVDIWSLGILLYVLLTGMMLLPKDDERKQVLLRKPGYISRRLKNCAALEKRDLLEQARDILEQMLEREPKKRIAASEALSHPFILSYCHEHLGSSSVAHAPDFDDDFVDRLRRFGKAPRLKKVALLSMAHLTDHERSLLVARHTFRCIDRDGDGVVTLDELKEVLAERGIEAPLDLDEIFAAVDSDSSGRLTFVEFLACLLPDQLIDESLCHAAFNVLDPENKGRLNAIDLQAVCPANDLQRCEKMVRQADTRGKGHFDFDDFHRLLRGEDAVADEPLRLKVRRMPSCDEVPPPPISPIAAPSFEIDSDLALDAFGFR